MIELDRRIHELSNQLASLRGEKDQITHFPAMQSCTEEIALEARLDELQRLQSLLQLAK